MTDQVTEKREEKTKVNGSRRRRAIFILLFLVIVGVIAGGWFWYRSKAFVSTDDAFIESHIYSISARISGHVTAVPVEDNQQVSRGDLLVALDPADYEVKVHIAEAKLAQAQNQTTGDYAQVAAAKAAVQQAQAQLEQADLDLKRGKALLADQTIPKEQVDRLETARRVAASRVHEAEQRLRRAQAMVASSAEVGGQEALIAQRQAELAQARLNLSYTQITAPADGYVTRKSVEVGTNVQPGQPLMAVVQLADSWVVANYKESQLTHVHPGQKVTFTVDAYPGREFSGQVNSIMAGTGAAFSLLPPENATGNYVKVVQRVPVKIIIDRESDPKHLLRVGMSVVPTIHTGRTLGEVLSGLNPFD